MPTTRSMPRFLSREPVYLELLDERHESCFTGINRICLFICVVTVVLV